MILLSFKNINPHIDRIRCTCD